MEQEQFDEGRGGALVEEAKRLMKNDEEAVQEQEEKGPKIKMSKIGGRKKTDDKSGKSAPKGAANRSDPVASTKASEKTGLSSGGGFTEQDIEFMKKAIQVLCQSTNPLGKSIDFVSDDIDSMNKEFEHWRKEAQACQSQLQEQQKITEEVIQPLQDQLADLEERIKEQTSKVMTIKSGIMRNDITVQNLLYSVISSR